MKSAYLSRSYLLTFALRKFPKSNLKKGRWWELDLLIFFLRKERASALVSASDCVEMLLAQGIAQS